MAAALSVAVVAASLLMEADADRDVQLRQACVAVDDMAAAVDDPDRLHTRAGRLYRAISEPDNDAPGPQEQAAEAAGLRWDDGRDVIDGLEPFSVLARFRDGIGTPDALQWVRPVDLCRRAEVPMDHVDADGVPHDLDAG